MKPFISHAAVVTRFQDRQGRAVTVSDCTNFANQLMCL